MTCEPEMLKSVPLFALLDDEETAVLAAHVDIRSFSPRERITRSVTRAAPPM
jgi:CRP/FNR family transcriptional regulator, cyclic AMP receptor protein